MVGGAFGSAGGAWAMAGFGAGIGTLIAGPPGAALGGFIGGMAGAFGGGWAGSTLFAYGVDSYHEIRDKEMERKRVDAVYAYYGTR